ncbi:hypothetical protein FQN54_009523 [Arachnomyces sp. PD_36]|nr:hypothetical protein FQN54_009523 [Arachnomyces sp. PD_36]
MFLWALFLGRVLQSVAGSATWVIGFALLANNIPTEHLGKSLGVTMSLVTAGIMGGPTVSGALLQLLGYWPAWSVPLVVLALDITARLLMVEPREFASPRPPNAVKGTTASSPDSTDTTPEDESTALLSEILPVNTGSGDEDQPKTPSTPSYYRLLLSNSRILASLLNILVSSSVLSGFNNTLPLHLRDTFGWGSLPTGMMFLCIQAPAILLGGLVGWLRDKAGIRAPTTFGWAASAPLLFFLGVPGDPRFSWAGVDANGEALFISCLSAYGVVSMLVRGVGSMQMALVVNRLQAQDPEKFSARAGNLRVFSMTEVAYSLGTMVGPLLTGLLIEGVGFFYMNTIIAAICILQAGVSFLYFDDKPASRASEPSV